MNERLPLLSSSILPMKGDIFTRNYHESLDEEIFLEFGNSGFLELIVNSFLVVVPRVAICKNNYDKFTTCHSPR